MTMNILIGFIPVGLSVLAYVVAFEARQAKAIRLERKLRSANLVEIPVDSRGHWVY